MGRGLLAADDRQIGQFGVSLGNHNVVAGEKLRSGQSDVDFLVLLLLDRDRLLKTLMVQTHTLDRHKVLSGRNCGNVNPVLLVSGVNLVNNTGTRVVETVEDYQYGIPMILGVDVGELETNSAGIHDFSRGGGSGSGL